MFHWILNTWFSLLHNAVPLLLSIRLAQVYSWEVSRSTFPYSPRFVFSDQVWSNFVLYDQVRSRRGSELFTFSRAFCYRWVNPSARLKQNIWNLLKTPNYIGLLCKKESIFKRITCGPWGEPKKSISPPAPVEPPGFLQRWWWWWDVRGSSCTILSTLKPIYECNIYAIKPLRLEGVKSNIARIANAVQVPICLLVSTSVYQCLLMSTNLNLNRCLCSHCSQCLLVSTSVY